MGLKLFKGVEIVEPYPAIYIEWIDAIVLADLHLGYEGAMVEEGIFVPRTQFEEETRALCAILEKKASSQIIINGDVKHKFERTSYWEFKEIKELFSWLTQRIPRVCLVRGNHDTFVGYLCRKFGIKLVDELLLDKILFAHGHREVDIEKGDWIIIAHEHPAVVLYDELGIKEKIPCLLYGKIGKRALIVLPAFSPLMSGSEINLMSKEELLSPMLKKIDLDGFEVIGIDREVGCFRFGKLKHLRY